jgi:hypothetical protein
VPVNQGFLCRANLCAAARRRPNCTASVAWIERQRNPGGRRSLPRISFRSIRATLADHPSHPR